MLLRWFISIFLNAVALIVVAQLFSDVYIENFGTALLASVILSMINVVIKPILVVLTLPITFMTFGLFLFVINAITLMIVQGLMDSSFVIEGFGMAILASMIISFLYIILNQLVRDAIS